MTDRSKKLARLHKLLTLTRMANETRLARQTAQDQRLGAELDDLDNLVEQNSLAAELFLDVIGQRAARTADRRAQNSRERDATALDVARGKASTDALARRLGEDRRQQERAGLERDLMEWIARR